MATVTIIHNMHSVSHDRMTRGNEENHVGDCLGPFFNFCAGCIARVAYSYETDRVDLEEIYRDNNVVDGWEHPVKYETRSLSVGDVVVIGDTAHKVASFGFEEVNPADVAQALANTPDPGFEIH